MQKNKLNETKERPILLIQQKNGRYLINQMALDIISSIQGNIAVVAVCGTYRTGKSYLMNRMLLSKSNGFGVGSTINPHTKGLWIWNKIIKCQDYLGNSISVLLIDSEGLASCEKDSNFDTKIFSLTILLSSIFIYNSIGSIDQNSIDSLAVVTNLTKMIQMKSSSQSQSNLNQYSPDFYWILRDFSLQLLNSNGRTISENQYLENSLRIQRNSTQQKNKIRKCITNFFRNRFCFTLVRPVSSEEDLQNLDKLQIQQLRPEFTEQVLNIRRKIFASLKPKQINGKKLNGINFCELINLYINSINKGIIPNIENTWNQICRNECQRALTECGGHFQNYIEELLGKIPLSDQQYRKMYKEVKKNILQIFNQKVHSNEIAPEYTKQLIKTMKSRFELLKIQNEKEIHMHCKQFLEKQFRTVENKISKQEINNMDAFIKQNDMFKQYFRSNYAFKGTTANVLFNQFIYSKYSKYVKYFCDKLSREIEASNIKIQEQKQQLKSLESQNKHLKQIQITKMIQSLNELTKKYELQKYQNQQYKIMTQSTKHQCLSFQQKLKRAQYEKQQIRKQLQEVKNKFNLMEELKYSTSQQFEMYKMQNQTAKILNQNKIKFYQELQHEFAIKEKQYMDQIKKTKLECQEKIRQMTVKIQSIGKRYTHTLQDAEDKLSAKIIEYNKLIEQKNELENKFLTDISEKNEKIFNLNKELKQIKLKKTMEFDDTIKNYQKNILNMQTQLNNQKEKYKKLKKQSDTKSQKIVQLSNIIKFHQDNYNALTHKDASDQSHKYAKITQLQDFIKKLEQQLNISKENFDILEKKTSMLSRQYQDEINQLNEQIKNLSQSKQLLLKQVNQSKNDKSSKFNQIIKNYEDKISTLQTQFTEARIYHQRTKAQQYQQYKLSLNNLRRIYDQEKQNIQNSIQQDKARYDKQIEYLKRDILEKDEEIKELLQNYEGQVKQLRTKLNEMTKQAEQNSLKNSMYRKLVQKDNSTDQQIDKLRNQISYYEEQTKKQNKIIEEYGNKYMILQSKSEDDKNEIYQLTKQNINLKNRIQNLELQIKKNKERNELNNQHLDSEKQEYRQKYEEIKNKYHKNYEEFMNIKSSVDKQLALTKQNNQFLSKKIQDYKNQNIILNNKLEDMAKVQKNDAFIEMREKLEEKTLELETMQKKYQKCKKSLKDIESNYIRQVSNLENEKMKLQELLSNSIKRNQELIAFHDQQSIYSNSRVSCLEQKLYFTADIQNQQLQRLKKQNEDLQALLEEYKNKQLHELTIKGTEKLSNDNSLKRANQSLKRQLEQTNRQKKNMKAQYESIIGTEREEKKVLKEKISELEIKIRSLQRGEKRIKIQRNSQTMLLEQIQILKKQRDEYILNSRSQLQELNELMNKKIEELERKLSIEQSNSKKLKIQLDKQYTCFNLSKQNLMDKINQLTLSNELLSKQLETVRRNSNLGTSFSPRNKYKFRMQQ